MLWLADGDRPPRQPGPAQPVRAQGRRPPGVQRLDGDDHDRAVVPSTCAPRTGCRSSRTPRRCCTRSTTCSASCDAAYLTTLREFGGLQSYPSRAQGPGPGRLLHRLGRHRRDRADLGRAGPPLRRRPRSATRGTGRQYSLVGDAELDEGACWEAVLDPMVGELGEVVWVVDLNRQSLDRVVPNIGATRLQGMFAAAGWQVLTVKYGRLLQELFARPGGDALRARIDEMPNPEYQRLLRCTAGRAARAAARRRRPARPRSPSWSPTLDDATLHAAIRNLGGHDLDALRRGVRRDRRHPADGDLRLHGQGLRAGHRGPPAEPLRRCSPPTQFARAGRAARASTRPTRGRRSPTARPRPRCARRPPTGCAATRSPPRAGPRCRPTSAAPRRGTATTQAALGRALLDLTRAAPDAGAARGHASAPDVSSSTNLGGWVNKVGVWSPRERVDWFADDPETILHWRETPDRPAPRAGHRRDQPGRAARRAGRHLEPVGRSRCCRSGCSTTRSSSARWSRGRSGSTRAGSRSWSARRPG